MKIDHLLNILCAMNLGVYGLGRFGSFWASVLRRCCDAGDTVYATSRRRHEVPDSVIWLDEDEFLSRCDVIYFCVAISSFESVLERVSGRIRKGALVMDTCSVKAFPAKWMERILGRDDVQLVATHPMFGPDSAKAGLSGLPVVVCPVRVDTVTLERLEATFSSWGLKVLRMSPLEHDREAAYSQGVTHFVGRTLRQMGLEDTEIATSGYKALMTIVDQTCNDPLQLFFDLQHYNPYAREMRLSLQVAIEKVLNQLRESEEGQTLV